MENSSNIEAYRLPVVDVQEKRRNFSGFQCSQPMDLTNLIKAGDAGITKTKGNK